MPNIMALAKIARDELVAMAHDGRLRGPAVWAAVRGGATYLAAVAKGDLALDDTQKHRADQCRICEHAKPRVVFIGGDPIIAWYCGEPFEDRTAMVGPEWKFLGKAPTCGCLVGISVNGEPLQHAAGKAVVDSEGCPLGKW